MTSDKFKNEYLFFIIYYLERLIRFLFLDL